MLGFNKDWIVISANMYSNSPIVFNSSHFYVFTMQVERSFKAGEDSYYKQQPASGPIPARNRWGDYSAACVDPLNDKDFWTVQEYSTPHVGSLINFSGRWAVW